MCRYYFARGQGTPKVASLSPLEEKKIKGTKRRKDGRRKRREEGGRERKEKTPASGLSVP